MTDLASLAFCIGVCIGLLMVLIVLVAYLIHLHNQEEYWQ